MDRDMILEYIENVFGLERGYYPYSKIPSTISYAIYYFGSNDIKDIVCFVDLSDDLDGSKGIIFTSDALYFDLNTKANFKYKDINSLKLHKDHNQYKGYINNTLIEYDYIQENMFIQLLSDISDISITLDMNDYEKIAYLTTKVLDDLHNEEYEDVILTEHQNKKIKEFYDEIDLIHTYTNNSYYTSLDTLSRHALEFFDELELESDEIDELSIISANMEKQQQDAFDQAKQYYDKMMDDFQKGDTKMLDQVKNAMKMLGIDESDIIGKSPSEVEDLLCKKLGISKEQLEIMKKKMGM